jgi:hypothetical protein
MVALTKAEVLAGIFDSTVGALLCVKWHYTASPAVVYEWHGELTARNLDPNDPTKCIGGEVRYPVGQRGMPKAQRGIAAIVLPLPNDGVVYDSIEYEGAPPTSLQELFNAQQAEAQYEERQHSMEDFVFHDVSTWGAVSEPQGLGAEVIKNRIAQMASVSHSSSIKRQNAFEAICFWVDTARTLDGWPEVDSFVKLGNSLVKSIRLLVAEESSKIAPEAVHRQMQKDDDTDPVGQAIAKLAEKSKPAFRKCTYCQKAGHTERFCH